MEGICGSYLLNLLTNFIEVKIMLLLKICLYLRGVSIRNKKTNNFLMNKMFQKKVKLLVKLCQQQPNKFLENKLNCMLIKAQQAHRGIHET